MWFKYTGFALLCLFRFASSVNIGFIKDRKDVKVSKELHDNPGSAQNLQRPSAAAHVPSAQLAGHPGLQSPYHGTGNLIRKNCQCNLWMATLDADTGLITTPFDDVGDLPNEVKDTLLKGLKSKNLLGDALAR